MEYLKGIVILIEDKEIVIEVSGIGFKLFISNSDSFLLNTEAKVFIYKEIKTAGGFIEINRYGFIEKEHRWLFKLLTKIKGIGTKKALKFLRYPEELLDALKERNKSKLEEIFKSPIYTAALLKLVN